MTPTQERIGRRQANNRFHAMGRTYHDGLPIQQINDVLFDHGFELLEPAIYCGRDGMVNEKVGAFSWFTLTWHKMEETGRYEVVAYVS